MFLAIKFVGDVPKFNAVEPNPDPVDVASKYTVLKSTFTVVPPVAEIPVTAVLLVEIGALKLLIMLLKAFTVVPPVIFKPVTVLPATLFA